MTRTEQAGGGRVLLDGLGHVVLYLLPNLPLKARMQDVERLHGVKHPVALVLSEDRVVCPVVPLEHTEAKTSDTEKEEERSKRGSWDVSPKVTWVRSAEKGAGSQATREPELYRELDRKRWASDAITWKESFKREHFSVGSPARLMFCSCCRSPGQVYLRVDQADGGFGTHILLVAKGRRSVETQHCIVRI